MLELEKFAEYVSGRMLVFGVRENWVEYAMVKELVDEKNVANLADEQKSLVYDMEMTENLQYLNGEDLD